MIKGTDADWFNQFRHSATAGGKYICVIVRRKSIKGNGIRNIE